MLNYFPSRIWEHGEKVEWERPEDYRTTNTVRHHGGRHAERTQSSKTYTRNGENINRKGIRYYKVRQILCILLNTFEIISYNWRYYINLTLTEAVLLSKIEKTKNILMLETW